MKAEKVKFPGQVSKLHLLKHVLNFKICLQDSLYVIENTKSAKLLTAGKIKKSPIFSSEAKKNRLFRVD